MSDTSSGSDDKPDSDNSGNSTPPPGTGTPAPGVGTPQPGAGGGQKPPGAPSNIDDLGTVINDLAKHGKPDVKLNEATRKWYVDTINYYRGLVETQHQRISHPPEVGRVGSLGSAIQTAKNLENDVTGHDGIQKTMTNYLNYLDAFVNTVNAAADRIIKNS
ncbi:hypothetical protein H5P33_29845 [Mycolicibacterium arabiense]|uniref:hypothetical protein n=1 Tax=Mycolicibacterium arabiense TaxID=1286181 RepID=UPI0013D783EC|nr:hypothetical protein [Mycolicibacterium arabiense]MCV7376919.1 hypothetical protein [Mycolicibacterium arabiense]